MSVIPKDVIKKLILPNLSRPNKGPRLSDDKLAGIIQLILYRLKSGCQWRELPVALYLEDGYRWNSVFHHFNKWSKEGAWAKCWNSIVRAYPGLLDMSCCQLDGSQTLAKRGGEKVAYQARKGGNSTNMLFISDANGILVAASQPESGNHHDVFDFEKHFGELIQFLDASGIDPEGLFMNADSGFDSEEVRLCCRAFGVIPNLDQNPRGGQHLERDMYFDGWLYQKRMVCERAFGWMDGFKALLIRYEVTVRNWFSLNIIGNMIFFLRKNQNLL